MHSEIRRTATRAAMLACALLLGCGTSDTRILVVVDADPTIRASLAAIEASTRDTNGALIAVHRFDLSDGTVALPFSFALTPTRSDRRAHVRLVGLDATGAPVVRRDVRTAHREGEIVRLVVALEACCAAPRACPDGQTCLGGACSDDAVDASALTAVTPGLELYDLPDWACTPHGSDGGTPDAGRGDAGDADGGVLDGGDTADAGHATCPSSTCACAGVDCTCASGETCRWRSTGGEALTCERDSVCDARSAGAASVGCDRTASCAIEIGPGSSAVCRAAECSIAVGPGSSVVCASNATCDVTCDGTCDLDCRGARSCTLRCGAELPRFVSAEARCP